MRLRRPSASCDGLGDGLGAQLEQHQQVAQVAREEGHLVRAGDEHRPGAGDRLDRRVDVAARARRAVSSTFTWSAASAVSNSVASSANSGTPPPLDAAAAPGPCRRYSSRAACWSSGKPSKPSACEKRTTVELEVLARLASSSAVWKAASSRWSTMYWATSFCERENSSKRETM